MNKFYDKQKSEFLNNITRLNAMKIPGVNSASIFNIEEFSVDALKRSTHEKNKTKIENHCAHFESQIDKNKTFPR